MRTESFSQEELVELASRRGVARWALSIKDLGLLVGLCIAGLALILFSFKLDAVATQATESSLLNRYVALPLIDTVSGLASSLLQRGSDSLYENTRSVQTAFALMMRFMGLMLATVVVAILITHWRRGKLTLAANESLSCYYKLEKLTLASFDLLILMGTFLVFSWPSDATLDSWTDIDTRILLRHCVVILLTICWFWFLLEHYVRRRPFWDELQETLRVLMVMFLVSGAASFVLGLGSGRAAHLMAWALNFALIPCGRAAARTLLDKLGFWRRPALIIGTGRNACEAYRAIKNEACMGYETFAFVNVDKASHESVVEIDGKFIPAITFDGDIMRLLEHYRNPQVIVAMDPLGSNERLLQDLVCKCRNLHIVPAIRGLPLHGIQLSNLFSSGGILLTVRHNLARRSYRWIKRMFDVVVASTLLVLLSPLMLVIALMVRRDGGKAVFGHERVGRHGQKFRCLKFRSMYNNASEILEELLTNDVVMREEWERDFKLRNDPRVTCLGRFLRKTSLDELPQLINVIRGEMSLVGPRPVVQSELERYGDQVQMYLNVLPGLTGLWQVSGRSGTTYAERVALDTWYVQNWSLWCDIMIMIKTVRVVVTSNGAY